METKPERDLIEQISKQYGGVIDLNRAPGVLVEILREFGPIIRERLGELGAGSPTQTVSSIAIAGPGSGLVTTEDLMRAILDLRKEVLKLSERLSHGKS